MVQATKWGSSPWRRLVLSQLIYCLKARKFLKWKLREEEPSRWGNSIGLIKPVERVLHSMYFSIHSSNSTSTDFSGLGNVYLSQWFSVISDVQHISNKLKMLRHRCPNLTVFYQTESYVKANAFSSFHKDCRKSYKTTHEVNGFMSYDLLHLKDSSE